MARAPIGRAVGSSDLRADLVAIVEAYAETYRSYGNAVTTLLFGAPRTPELRPAVEAPLPNLASIGGVLAHHQRLGRLVAGSPLEMVVSLLGPIMVTGLWRRTGVPADVPEHDTEAIVDTFLLGTGRQ